MSGVVAEYRKKEYGMQQLQYPAWLYPRLVEDRLPWDQAKEMTFERFDAKYTLHDSCWVGTYHDVGLYGDVTLAFEWDYVWTTPEVKAQNPSENLLYLLIMITDVREVVNSGYVRGEMDYSRVVGTAEQEIIDGHKVFSIDDSLGGSLTVAYDGILKFLALDQGQRIIDI